jgi:LysR family glycine cleavage system transcriptional activator
LAQDLHKPEDLNDQICLRDTTWAEDWDLWTHAARPGQAFAPRGPVFSLYALALEETMNGAGVLMGHSTLTDRHLTSGRLVAPFGTRVALPDHLRLWSARPLRSGSPAGLVSQYLKQSAWLPDGADTP